MQALLLRSGTLLTVRTDLPQVRKLSVKQIVSPIVFDNLKNAVPGGLCDAALGPMEPHGT